MNALIEVKLSTDKRNDLPDSEFGLPKERKFPLNDESHVNSAIKFFKFAKPDQRRELAKNINLRLKKFNMTVNVSSNNPFYKYIDRKYLSESSFILNESMFTYRKNTNNNSIFDDIIMDLASGSEHYINEDYILDAEARVNHIIKTNTDFSENLILFLRYINNLFKVIYNEYFNYLDYSDVEFSRIYYGIIDDIRETILNKYISTDYDIRKEYKYYLDFIKTVNRLYCMNNSYYLYRIESDIYYNLYSHYNDFQPHKEINLSDYYPKMREPVPSSIIIYINFKNVPPDDSAIMYNNIRKILLQEKRKIESDLYTYKLLLSNILFDTMPLGNNAKHYLNLYDTNINIKDKISSLSYLDKRLVDRIDRSLNFNITQADLMQLKNTKYIDNFVYSIFDNDTPFWYGVKGNDLYIIGKIMSDSDIIYKLIELSTDTIRFLQHDKNTPKIKIITLTFPIEDVSINDTSLMEGLSIDELGNIKISINPKKSYMDEYMESHRILAENYKNKNFEAMKNNIAFMFLLINVIERDKLYKDRDPEAIKARAFAINDFKTYLSYIQKNDPSFNFEKYYRDLELDKYVINIPKESIIGIKKLLKSIIL